MLSRSEEYEKLRMKQLKEANISRYNYEMCLIIERKIAKIDLPKLTREEMMHLKEHLEDYKKIDSNDLRYKFLSLRNCFLLINEFEDREQFRTRIRPIMQCLEEFKYIFDMIIESEGKKESPMLDKAINILHLPINKFCMLYSYILTEVDVNSMNFDPIIIPEAENNFEPPKETIDATEYEDEPIEDTGSDELSFDEEISEEETREDDEQ
jgi:hypothetical protein